MKELFEKAGIESKPYAKAPNGAGVFIVSLNPSRDVVRYWLPKNNENLEIQNQRFSKKFNQVSFSVIEPRRTLTCDADIEISQGSSILSTPGYALRRRFNVSLPAETKYEIIKHKKVKSTIGREWYDRYAVTIKATVPASKQHFLVGKDESNLFVSALPKAAKSVEDAHLILRPDGAVPSTPRQGEWFFLPADLEQDALDKKYVDQVSRTSYRYANEVLAIENRGWNSSNHKASMIVRSKGNKTYVRGLIFDTSGRHHNLNFDKWMLAVKNKELESQGVYWD